MAKQGEFLGYVFGFKEISEEADNRFHVSFKSGVSKKYPAEHANKKDFYADEVRSGDYSEIFINLDLAYEVFKRELAQNMPDSLQEPSGTNFYEEIFRERSERFSHPINVEQFIALTSFSMIGLHFVKPYESLEARASLLQRCVGSYFEGSSIPVVDAYRDYERVSAEVYDEELQQALGTFKL
jgi:hypothetical protein